MNLKNFRLGFILFFVFSIVAYEAILCLQRGLPPLEDNPPQFDYKYVEIYRRFFKRVRLPDGRTIYKPQRSKAEARQFLADKDKGLKRVFVLGGSVAMIFNDGACLNYLKSLFEDLIPGMQFEIIGCGMGAYDSYRVSIIHKEILNYNPDLIILMSGNNEYYNPVKLNLWAYRSNRLFRRLWVYRDLQEKFLAWNENRGMYNEIFQDNQLINYENNLRIMIRRAKKRKIPMALCTLPANFRDAPPLKHSLFKDDRQFFLAWDSLQKGDFEEAIKGFKQFLITHPEEVLGHYFLARCYDAMKDYPKAQASYLKALNLDFRGGRCTPEQNKIIRNLCAQEGVILIDLEQAFIKIAPYGLIGSDLFVDSCHWWSEYNSLVCEKVIQSIIEYNRIHSKPVLSSLGNWQYKSVVRKPDYLENKPIDLNRRALRITSNSIGNLSFSLTLSESLVSFLKTAYQLDPNLFDDKFVLKEQIFKEISKSDWTEEIVPSFDKYWSILLYHMGEAFRRLGLYSKAIDYLDEAIRLNPSPWVPYLIRGLAYYKIGQIQEVERDFQEASRRSNQHPWIRFYKESLGI